VKYKDEFEKILDIFCRENIFGKRKENKKESDRGKIINLFVFLDKGKQKRMTSELPEKQKRKIQKFCAENKFEF
jgi:predicted RNA-binding protein (virulence factor B family)